MRTTTRVAAVSLLVCASQVVSQGLFTDTGADSFYWHQRYHGILAMATYGDPNVTCRETFTDATLKRQGINAGEEPFQFLGSFGPTPNYGMEGYMVKVPEMNKILFVLKDVVGWQNFNATLAPLLNVGCDNTCMAHADAINAAAEVTSATNDFQAISDNQGSFVFSSSGHGFGGAVAQVLALQLKTAGRLFSCMTFGAPPVFNDAAVNTYNAQFPSDDSQRCVANQDSIPASVPVCNWDNDSNCTSTYRFVSTGVWVYGSGNATYGQNYEVCFDDNNPDCMGGTDAADHWFYFTRAGTCGQHADSTYNANWNKEFNAAILANYSSTATASIGAVQTSFSASMTTTTTTTTTPPPASSTTVPPAADQLGSSTTAAPTERATLTGGASMRQVSVLTALVAFVGVFAFA